jgi:catalase
VDALSRKMQATQALAVKFPHNANKPLEYGEHTTQPEEGQRAKPPDVSVTGSTLTEEQASPKVGAGEPNLGSNPTNAPLDRVRVDSSGRGLTTNQGVPIADNQNSLKAGPPTKATGTSSATIYRPSS